MAFISAVTWLVAKAGFDMDTEILIGVVSPLWAYIFAQGVADHGKGKEEVKAESVAKIYATPIDDTSEKDVA